MHTQRAQTRFCLEQPWFVFSATQRYQAAQSLDTSISHFYSFVADRPSSSALAIPDGCVDLIFECDATRPNARVCGSPSKVRAFALNQGQRYFGVRFCSGINPAFLSLSAGELKDQEIDLCEAIKGAETLVEMAAGSLAFDALCKGVERFFEHAATHENKGLTQRVIGLIKQHRGTLAMRELETHFACTSRTLQRQFKQDTGMSPKAFSRIVRCQEAFKLLEKPRYNALDVALELGFSDQSHFQREFKELVSLTPLDYAQRTHGEYGDCIELSPPARTITVH